MEKHLIDDRNGSLWESVNRQFKITVESHPNHHFYYHCIDDEIILFVPEENGTIELMTHELLHLHLIANGINVKNVLKDLFRNEPLLHWSLNENLFEQIGECLEHSKMLPLYLSMGFQRDLFCETYYMPCCNEMSMQIIRCGMNKVIPTKISFHHFIHKYFAMTTCLNPEFDYEFELGDLKEINGELYAILEKFRRSWDAFKIKKNDAYTFKALASELVHELGMWSIMNIYAKQNIRA